MAMMQPDIDVGRWTDPWWDASPTDLAEPPARYGAFASNNAYLQATTRQFYARRFAMTFPNEELPAGRPLKTTPCYDALRAVQPEIIHAVVSAFGEDGPYRLRPAVDSVVQCVAGGFYASGDADDDPIRVGLPIVDVSCGMAGAFGILAAIMHWRQTGKGQRVETVLVDAMFNLMATRVADYALEGQAQLFPGMDPTGSFISFLRELPQFKPELDRVTVRDGEPFAVGAEARGDDPLVRILAAGSERGIPFLAMELVATRPARAARPLGRHLLRPVQQAESLRHGEADAELQQFRSGEAERRFYRLEEVWSEAQTLLVIQ